MKTLMITAVGLFAAALVGLAAWASQPASAFNTLECNNGKYWKWAGSAATYDRTHGDFAQWWQDAIDDAADLWDDQHEADFYFHHYSGSSRDWDKEYAPSDDRPAWADVRINNANDCHLEDVDVFFNTSKTFSECGDDCDQGEDEWDVKHVAAHEFSHFFALDDTPWPWYATCISYPKHNTDYTVCNHERNHVQDYYGEED